MPLTSAQGAEVVRLARRTLDTYVSTEERPKSARWTGYLGERRGAFVTLNLRAPEGESLRGCIGFPYPVKELGEAVVESTIGAASEDPRFPPVQLSELTGILVEVSALTKPETIKVGRRTEIPSTIRIGIDGLIVSTSYQSGLLLPQVAAEFNLKPADFLTDTCIKAGLPPDSWLLDGVNVQKFQAEVFAEAEPRGTVKAVTFK
jgi:uncharacterized protein (TIGR00296 family)